MALACTHRHRLLVHGNRSNPSRAPRVATRAQSTILGSTTWAEFASKYSGEWEGVTASFDADGKPIPLDPHYVPGAYRDWGVEVHDWQSTCSSLADPGQPGKVALMCRRMMPTVGCEADAVAYTEEASADNQAILAHSPAGSYVAGPLQLKPDDSQATIEVCLVVAQGSSGDGKPARLRLVHKLQRNWQSGQWTLYKVDVHHERWDSAFRGKVELCGCGGGMPVFATSPAIAPEQVAGWVPVAQWSQAWAYAPTSEGAVEPSSSWYSALPSGGEGVPVVRLPLGLWCRNQVSGAQGDIWLEIGGLMRTDAAVSSQPSQACCGTVVYKDGSLLGAALGQV